MGIKTKCVHQIASIFLPLKNLPTTWGLRRFKPLVISMVCISEKPPHHMGIKTSGS